MPRHEERKGGMGREEKGDVPVPRRGFQAPLLVGDPAVSSRFISPVIVTPSTFLRRSSRAREHVRHGRVMHALIPGWTGRRASRTSGRPCLTSSGQNTKWNLIGMPRVSSPNQPSHGIMGSTNHDGRMVAAFSCLSTVLGGLVELTSFTQESRDKRVKVLGMDRSASRDELAVVSRRYPRQSKESSDRSPGRTLECNMLATKQGIVVSVESCLPTLLTLHKGSAARAARRVPVWPPLARAARSPL